jgi:hypothetical protein
LLGGQLAEAPGIDPYQGKIGLQGSGQLSGQVCYTDEGWKAKACLSGSISVIAEFKVYFVTVGGSYELVGGQICSSD